MPDELKEVNAIDDAESRAARQVAAGIVEQRPWVWLRWSRIGGMWKLVPQISLDGAYELYRRYLKDTRLFLSRVESFETPKGAPVISIIMSIEQVVQSSDGSEREYIPLAYGGQDGFIVQSTEAEERKLHGTAAALHKAIRNCIVNCILLHHGTDCLLSFVNEAIEAGKAAILERDGSYRFITKEELGRRPKGEEEGDTAEKRPATEKPTTQPQTRPTPSKIPVLQQLGSIPPETLNQWLLLYSEIIQKDPHSFGETEWTDFVKWTKTQITQREIDDLVQLASTLYKREHGIPPTEAVDRREAFRYIARNFLERGQRITELTQPQYHLLRQKLQSELWKSMQVLKAEEDIPDNEPPEPGEEDTFTSDNDLLEEFPF
jgi:hypothetical protein